MAVRITTPCRYFRSAAALWRNARPIKRRSFSHTRFSQVRNVCGPPTDPSFEALRPFTFHFGIGTYQAMFRQKVNSATQFRPVRRQEDSNDHA